MNPQSMQMWDARSFWASVSFFPNFGGMGRLGMRFTFTVPTSAPRTCREHEHTPKIIAEIKRQNESKAQTRQAQKSTANCGILVQLLVTREKSP